MNESIQSMKDAKLRLEAELLAAVILFEKQFDVCISRIDTDICQTFIGKSKYTIHIGVEVRI